MSIESSADVWLTALTEATSELAETTLEMQSVSVATETTETTENLSGAYLSLIGDSDAVQVGIASDKDGCSKLARALLMMEDDEELSEEDMIDALGEIVNIVAGSVKTMVSKAGESMTLGLPIVVRGQVLPTIGAHVAAVKVLIGSIPAQLIVLQKGRTSSRA